MGFRVVRTVDTARDIFAECEAGLRLLAKFDGRQFRHMQRNISQIGVSPTVSSYYEPALRGIFLSPRVVDAGWPGLLAATLIHESTHARLRRLSWSSYNRDRMRHERVCFRAQSDLLAKLPADVKLQEMVEAQFRSVDWSEADHQEIAELVRQHGFPSWFERTLASLRRLFSPVNNQR